MDEDMDIGISPEEMSRIVTFARAASGACVETDKDIVFTCPPCDGEAHVFRTSYNGHRHAHCKSCGAAMM